MIRQEFPNGIIYNENCIGKNGMCLIPDKSVDMILCDLPYGTTACKWDTIIPFEPLWEQYKRIIKDNGAIVLFGNEPFSSYLRLSNINQYRYDIVWNKKKPSNFQLMNFQPGRIHEYIHIFSKSPAVFCHNKHMKYFPIKEEIPPYKRNTSFYGSKNSTLRRGHTIKELGPKIRNNKNKYYSIVDFTNANIKIKKHPTAKPVALFEYLIKTYTNEGETVLDNCAGSGTTGVACLNAKRKFILYEWNDKDNEYFEPMKKRIEEWYDHTR